MTKMNEFNRSNNYSYVNDFSQRYENVIRTYQLKSGRCITLLVIIELSSRALDKHIAVKLLSIFIQIMRIDTTK